MRLLLDTHVFLWLEQDPGRIAPAILKTLQDPENILYLSAVSVWEIATKKNKGALRFDGDVQAIATRYGLLELSISWAHSQVAGALPLVHRDPFDRMLVAQAQVEDLTLVSIDRYLQRYDVRVLWA